MKQILNILTYILVIGFTTNAVAGNDTITSFNKAKRILEKNVYFDNRETLYCGAEFDSKKKVSPPSKFTSEKYQKRALKIEWEHVVPAENFGRAFSEWREGNAECIDNKRKAFKGRSCASKMNMEYRFMQADLYNLFPAIGSVNALRSNYQFTMLPGETSDFGSCDMKIEDKKAEPPQNARGRIARAYLYMDTSYGKYKMSKQTRQLMNAWNTQYPVSEWECIRAKRIEKIQGNPHPIYKAACKGQLY